VPTSRSSKSASSLKSNSANAVMQVAICGYKHSGKSSLLQRLNGDELYSQDPSVSGCEEEVEFRIHMSLICYSLL
jgi:50S ribosomal subunit-associated GTPase HflX